MYSEERHRIIVDTVNSLGKVNVKVLSEKLDVSEVTIRRDLDMLDKKGLLKRTFGGAIRTNSIMREYSLSEREKLNINEKRAIAKRALDFIEEGMSIYIDSGTTTKILSSILDHFKQLTVFTADLLVGYNLSSFKNIDVKLIGGTLDKSVLSASSADTLRTVSDLFFDLSFIGCDAFDQYAVYSASEMRSFIKKEVIKNSKQSILLTDSSKFNRKKLHKTSDLHNFDFIISDNHNPVLIKEFEKYNLISVDI